MKLVLTLLALAGLMAGQSPPRPPFRPLRYDEDWSALRNPALRTEWLDRLKYIGLGSDDRYLSIGGEVRPWYEFYRNEFWGASPQDGNGYVLQRYMLHADLHWSDKFRIFGQLKSGIETGRRGGPRGPDEDRFDLHQAFFDWRPRPKVRLRAGRQEIGLGSQRLLAVREGPNVRQSFDAIRLTLPAGGWSVDAIVAKPVTTKAGVLDDTPDHARTLWSVYAVGPRRLLSRGGQLDLYYIGLDRKLSRFFQGRAREERHTFGARVWNRAEALDYNFELMWQTGRFGRGALNAWTAASDTGYTFSTARWRPRLGLRGNITSGDRDPNDVDLQTFNPLFPRGNYFGQLTSLGPQNHIDLHPVLDLAFNPKLAVTFDMPFFWRFRTTDGIYGIPGNLLRGAGTTRARFIGYQPGAELRYQLDRHFTFSAALGAFVPGQYLKDNPPARTTLFAATWITWRF